jgi:signal transduction histidine kinase
VRRFWLENWFPVRLGEETIGVGAVVEEITARKAAEDERERLLAATQAANAEAQAAVAVRNAFLANVSHDLRTPLTTIKGYAQVLRRASSRARDVGALTAGLAAIEQAAGRMTTMLEELVDAAQMQSGHELELVRRPMDLVALARRVVAEHQATDSHALTVSAALPELVGCWDSARLERVIGNLLSNAVKYSSPVATVTVSVSRELIDGTAWATLAVQDEGIGIPAADLPYVFERFFRGGNVTGRIRGTGIGLAGAEAIVSGHGGTIAVTSVEGRGSTFTVRLPLHEAGALPPAQM